MNKLYFDFETYSEVDITTEGAYKYAMHPSTCVLCLGIRVGYDGERVVWVPGMPVPSAVQSFTADDRAYAFNASFEILIWHFVLMREYGDLFPMIEVGQWIDVKALCQRFRQPSSLDKAGKALGCATDKMAVGKKLIRKCCKPGGNPTPQDFQDLYMYCGVDVDVMIEILQALPADHFTPREQELWELTYKMNFTGVPVDKVEIQAIIDYLATYMAEMVQILPEVTDGLVTTPGQTAKMKAFALSKGVELPNMQADTISAMLDKDSKEHTLPEDVRSMLEVRQALGSSSVKKFVTLLQLERDGIVQGNLNFHGAGTGRWAGYGFQYHALPRAKKKKPEIWIKRFVDKSPIKYPVKVAKALIRPMIKAPKDHSIIIADYSSIENRMLAWMCGDEVTLQLFRDGGDQYIDMATYVFNKPYDAIVKAERQFGKALVLGCGFGMGKKRFQAAALEQYGLEVSLARAEELVRAYRGKYPLVTRMWRAVDLATKQAVRYPGKIFESNRCRFKVVTAHNNRQWLRITLPSGRSMMYADPRIEQDKYGPTVIYTGYISKFHKMGSIALTPGLITENIIQGSARDCLGYGMLTVDREMPEVKLSISIHDEAGGAIHNKYVDENTQDKYNKLLCTREPWYADLPLAAEGYIGPRFKKD